jgi:S-DNA-T family DNA segregation ATPase FtsK/SpoIIIE
MAATRKARSEKSVLSRQDIHARRKSLGEQKLKAPSTGRTAIWGTFVLAGSALLLLSLGTFDAHDRVGPGYRNAVGPVGHLLAELFRGGFGITSYVLPFIGLYAAMVMFVGDKEKKRGPQVVSAVMLMLSTGVLAHLAFRGEAGWVHPPGGALGRVLGEGLASLFSTVGTVILVSAVCVAALIVGTQYVFLNFCAWAWEKACVGWALFVDWAQETWAKQKEAYAQRKLEQEKAKAEEAAFLAQLEEDERALQQDEAELAAAEAEAVEEEALRLAREAEARRKADEKAAKQAEREKKQQEREAKKATTAAAAAGVAVLAAAPAQAEPAARSDEPAWVRDLAPSLGAAPAKEESSKETAPLEAKKQPVILEPPAPPPPTPRVEASAATTAAASDAAEASGPQVSSDDAAALGKPSALPVIVEPKAPPKPSKKQEEFEFTGDRKAFTLPPLELLSNARTQRNPLDKEAFLSTAEKLRAKFAEFGILGEVKEIRPGPVVTMYEFKPGEGIRISKIASLANDLAMAMEAKGVRILAPIPGKNAVGIEVPNKDRETVYLREIAEQDAFQKSPSRVTLCLGKDIEGMPYIMDLAKAPHLLMAGTTGSGKSVSVNSMIMSLLMKSTPEEVRFIMVDPKQLELSVYEGIPHLLLPVVTDPRKAANALHWAVEEMERRYKLLAEAGVRNIVGYNAKVADPHAGTPAPAPAKDSGRRRKMLIVDAAAGETADEAAERARRAAESADGSSPALEEAPLDEAVEAAMEELPPTPEETAALREAAEATAAEHSPKQELKKLPYIVVIIDELADLIMTVGKEVETSIARIAQKARAAGIHLMVATQRPSTDIVTGVIKANFPTRISFSLRTRHDSATILGTNGAEALLGQGDMLVLPPTSAYLQRAHGAYVSEEEIFAVVNHLKAQAKPVYDESILKPRGEDPAMEADEGGEEEADESYDQALAWVSQRDKISVSLLQRQFRFGYNKAARIMERLEREGVVGPADGARPRDVLVRGLGEMPGAGAM